MVGWWFSYCYGGGGLVMWLGNWFKASKTEFQVLSMTYKKHNG